MPARLRLLAAAVVVTAAGVGVGLYTHDPDGGKPTPADGPGHTASTLTDVDTTAMVVRRQAFCDHVATAEVTKALGGDAIEASSYGDGDKAELGGETDVAQEYACTWTGQNGTAARAWVFAPPVTKGWARRLAGSLPQGCERRPGPAYGKPSVAFACTNGKRTTVSLRGLFGDAWLSCDLVGARGETADEVGKRADRWCLMTAVAAG